MNTLTKEQQQKIADWLANHDLPSGLGTEESACSIASINLALTGRLTDAIPECMSPVIGRWIIRTQDAMPADIRNGAEWKRLLPLAAGTGRNHEKERIAVILDWMWTVVLPQLQSIADANGFGVAWMSMCQTKTVDSAATARAATAAAAARKQYWLNAADAAAADAATAAYAYADAYADAATAARAADAATTTARAAAAAAYAATDAATDAAYADAATAATAAAAAARKQYWRNVDPCALLAKLIAVSE